ncbi:hypothetical protein BDQ12DRAFT_658652 [Crucibulum laeve]|uniref:BTB domain-containing protein n=1 Tax=Crucibulum laeve TaxID=68775 RepID=A0A5C3LIC4_9AGAR|nr:hypothetical protein BDQ12DRAFT_658652 [Crucibulum laeve]
MEARTALVTHMFQVALDQLSIDEPAVHDDTDLYFEDGNIILQAEQTRFRLHKSIITARCPVFRDMLSFPQPAQNELIDGCVVVKLPDTANDAGLFFRAIYDYSFFEAPPAPAIVEDTLSILSLSHKYDVPNLHRRALAHLSTAHVCTLEEWDAEDSTALTFRDIEGSIADPLLRMIEVVYEVNALWLLPTIFYLCCSHPLQKILDSPQWISGSICETHKRTVLLGWAKQQHETLSFQKALIHAPTANCITHAACAAHVRRWDVSVMAVKGDKLPGGISPLASNGGQKFYYERLCQPCSQSMKTMAEQKRIAFWNMLPSLFGLPGWDELMKMKAAALKCIP